MTEAEAKDFVMRQPVKYIVAWPPTKMTAHANVVYWDGLAWSQNADKAFTFYTKKLARTLFNDRRGLRFIAILSDD